MRMLTLEAYNFLYFFVLHILVWRLRLPARQTRALTVLTLVSWFILVATQDVTISEAFYLLVLHTFVTFSYIISYTMVEEESPSSLILLSIEKNNQTGLTKNDLQSVVNNDRFLFNRITGLERDGMVIRNNTKLTITPKGNRFLNIFLLPRRLMGLQKLGG